MKKWKMGILGTAEIASKRFLPALCKSEYFSFAGIASRDKTRCIPLVEKYGGVCYPDYLSLLKDPEIDCVYLPFPPALHAPWGEQVLVSGKHLLMEKPFTSSLCDTNRLLILAEQQGLAIHENYMFLYHRQFARVNQIINSGELGSIRMIRIAFTFPFRGDHDFRYNSKLGGGALLDCGGYPLLLAGRLLGESSRLLWSGLHQSPKYKVDTAGSAVLQNSDGLTAHVFFGMDDTYRCELEVWGSKSSLIAPRIFTAPPDLSITLQINSNTGNRMIEVAADDQFLNSINTFATLIDEPNLRGESNRHILSQAKLIERIQRERDTFHGTN